MTAIRTKARFESFKSEVESRPGYRRPRAFGIGIAALDSEGKMLDTYYPHPNYQSGYGTAAACAHIVGHLSGNAFYEVDNDALARIHALLRVHLDDGGIHPNIDVIETFMGEIVPSSTTVICFIDTDEECNSLPDAYLRLHLLSHRLVLPNMIGAKPAAIMPHLPNVVWTSEGPISQKDIKERQMKARLRGTPLRVFSVDKLPHMLDYVVPSGVRIADTARVRLGAHVGEGTTVMPAGAINFNAGTLGKAMIEGRVSQGVIVGDGSDLGGASSTQGTMSGGSKEIISIGERTLISALAGTGISLGDDCIIAAGVYVMPSNDVILLDAKGMELKAVKAHQLSGESGILFRRGTDGRLEAVPNSKAVELNPLLHADN